MRTSVHARAAPSTSGRRPLGKRSLDRITCRASGACAATLAIPIPVPNLTSILYNRTVQDPSPALSAALGDRYEIQALAGTGGMAIVYRARDIRHDRLVAIKVLRPGVSVGADRFRREIEIAARLQHPNILPVFDSGDADGQLFYVMPFIAGESLRGKIDAHGAMSQAEAIGIIREVADALRWAHKAGVVHRDIKPENILFSAGHALVADFGIARMVSIETADRNVTEAGFALGTPAYMSPEQAFAEPVDERTDLYAVGCVFYEMLTGAPPFGALPATSLLVMKTTRDVPPPQIMPPLSRQVEHALLRALARDVSDRQRSLDEFLAELDRGTAEYMSAASRVAPSAEPRIAVFPFDNVGGDADDAYFAEGLAEELIHALGGTRGLRVLARNTAFALHDSVATSTAGAVSSVKVDVLLRGSVRRRGERLRVVAHLVDARSGVEMWSERYDRNFTDIFDIQDEITQAIVESLRAELLSPATQRTALPNVAAYESYLEARFFWNRRSVTGMKQSVRLLKDALKLDGTYAPAYAALAETHVTLAIYGAAAPAEAMRDARAAAERALQVSPDLGEAISALACVRALWDWDWTGAASDFRRAVESSPQSPTVAQWYAMHALVPQKDFPLAFRQLTRAQELDPLSSSAAGSIGVAHFYARDYDAAADTLRALIARDPEFAAAHGFLGQVCAERGDHQESVEHLRRALELAPDSPEFIAALGLAHARAGNVNSAREMLATLSRLSTERFVSPVGLAQIHAALGESDNALKALDDAVSVRATDLAWIGVRPAFDTLRGDPRFTRVLDTIHLA